MSNVPDEIVIEVTPVEAPSPNEISKKELLKQTGISYGQLYRWKREGLIPEEWFEKRSAFTGQETFFPRELVLERVKGIQSMKDDLSLSEIRERLERMPGQQDLRKTLLAVTDMSEGFIDRLDLDWDKTSLSESSLKAIATLSSALDKAEVEDKTKTSVLAEALKALNNGKTDLSEEG